MDKPSARLVHRGRALRLQHGPIDLVVGCTASSTVRRQIFIQVIRHFDTVLDSLVQELPCLRRDIEAPRTAGAKPAPQTSADHRPRGRIARNMWRACLPYAASRVSPMAAVAGAVADDLLRSVLSVARPSKLWINNGGDIAVFLDNNETFDCGVVDDLATAQLTSVVTLGVGDGIGGIATSGQATRGQRGRSFSLGIADAVTVLAATAADADAASTLIANQVDLPGHANIVRLSADELDPDTDLGTREVVTSVGYLSCDDIDKALTRGRAFAFQCLQRGLISGALLSLRGQRCMIGNVPVANRLVDGLREPASATKSRNCEDVT